jgi:hypothetical protein
VLSHFVADLRRGVDRAATLVDELDREAGHHRGLATLGASSLQGLLPGFGFDAE